MRRIIVWPQRTMVGEQLVLVLHPEPGHAVNDALRAEISRRNAQLLNYKRISGYAGLGPGFSAHRLDENQARRPGRTDRQATGPQRDGCPVNETLFHDRESGRGRRPLREARSGARSTGCARRALRSKCARRARPAKPRFLRAKPTPPDFAISSPSAATARASRSSTDFFPARSPAAAPRWVFCRSEPEIPFCAISPNAARNTPFEAILAHRRRPVRCHSPEPRGRVALLHQHAEHGIRGGRRHAYQSPLEIPGRARLSGGRAGFAGAAAPPPVSLARRWRARRAPLPVRGLQQQQVYRR